jgi:hypothetical protein
MSPLYFNTIRFPVFPCKNGSLWRYRQVIIPERKPLVQLENGEKIVEIRWTRDKATRNQATRDWVEENREQRVDNSVVDHGHWTMQYPLWGQVSATRVA